MSNSAKFLAGACVAAASLAMISARAEVDTDKVTVTGATGSSATAPAVKVTGDGGVFFQKGVTSSNASTVSSGAGLLWYAPKNALIISDNFGASPSPTGVGTNTVSIFSKIVPTAANAIAIGCDTAGSATGANSLVIHGGNATGTRSVVINGGYATGADAVSISGASAQGNYSFAAGGLASAQGAYSVALGGGAPFASGWLAVALGSSGAEGDESFSANLGYAYGDRSVALGSATAQAYQSVAIGRYNITEGDPLTWQSTDPLFVVGNGADFSHPNDAFVIYKNGDIKISKPQGDILMGEFGE